MHELKDIINEMDDSVGEFIILMDTRNGPDQMVLIDDFRRELQNTGFYLAETVHRMRELNNSINMGMLQVVDHPGNGIKLVAPSHYREVSLHCKGRKVHYCMSQSRF